MALTAVGNAYKDLRVVVVDYIIFADALLPVLGDESLPRVAVQLCYGLAKRFDGVKHGFLFIRAADYIVYRVAADEHQLGRRGRLGSFRLGRSRRGRIIFTCRKALREHNECKQYQHKF